MYEKSQCNKELKVGVNSTDNINSTVTAAYSHGSYSGC